MISSAPSSPPAGDGDDDIPSNSNELAAGVAAAATPWDEAAAVLSGLVGGGRYGLKIRVPHAFVMTFLFGSRLSLREKLRVVARLAAEHASNLAAFACLYKLVLATLKAVSQRIQRQRGCRDDGIRPPGTLRLTIGSLLRIIVDGPYAIERRHIALATPGAPGLPHRPHHAFLAGALGGYVVWGRYSNVNHQLLLYLASRVFVGCFKLASERVRAPPFSWRKGLGFANAYPWAAAGIWGTVMALFEGRPDVLHPSLRRSMDEIYRYDGFWSGTDRRRVT